MHEGFVISAPGVDCYHWGRQRRLQVSELVLVEVVSYGYADATYVSLCPLVQFDGAS